MIAETVREFRYPPVTRRIQHIKLAFVATACAILFGIALFSLPPDHVGRVGIIGFAVVSFLGALALWRDLPKARTVVQVSSDGISQIRDAGRQLHIPWSEVAAFRNHWFPRGVSIETADRTKVIRIDADMPQFDDLLKMIVSWMNANSAHFGNSAV